MNHLLLDNELFVPVSYAVKAIKATHIVFNSSDYYPKMGYRNRFRALAANGVVTLTVPIKGGRNRKQQAGEVLIDYSSSWQRNHLRTLQSAYGRAPFFEYYSDALTELYKKRPERLWDWNLLAWKLVEKWLGCKWQFDDLASGIPLSEAPENMPAAVSLELPAYQQVFGEQFIPDLSIIDAVLNLGPSFRLHHARLL